MPLPSSITYNDLNGEEVKHVLEERFALLLSQVPYLQRHLTIPRCRMTLMVQLESYADQPNPEAQIIEDEFEILTNQPLQGTHRLSEQFASTVDASPSPGGKPPDQIRDENGIPIPTPRRGDKATGSHLYTTDDPQPLQPLQTSVENRVVEEIPGVRIDRTAQDKHATMVTQDFGPAGLRAGGSRVPLSFRSGQKG